MIDVNENEAKVKKWVKNLGWTFPVLLDEDGKTAARYAPPGVLPDLPRDQVPIASNLIIDPEGKIRFYSLLDSKNFDTKLIALTARLEELLAARRPKPDAMRTRPGPPAIVQVEAPPAQDVSPGTSARVRIKVVVADGYHVQANPASEPFLIPLRLGLDDAEGMRVGQVVYPPGQPYYLQGAPTPLATYSGAFHVEAPLSIDPSVRQGVHVLSGRLYYQACNDRTCLQPASVAVSLVLRVIGDG